MQTLASVVELIAAILAVVALVRRHRKALRDHPPIDYTPDPVPWRWAAPPAGLTVRQAEGVSIIELPQPRRVQAVIAELAAYGIGLLVGAMGISGLIHGLPIAVHLMVLLIFGPLIFVCLQMATRLVRIELRPDAVTFVERGGLWWHRQRTRRRPLRISGKMASVFAVEAGRDPEHEIRLGGLRGARMRSACNQTQGSWVVGGLDAWSAAEPA